jgi:hypothetical protein
LCDTVSRVTQVMLEDAKLKRKAKASVKAAMTCAFGVVKVLYQRTTVGESDPVMRSRIQDTQDNIRHIDSLIAKLEDPAERAKEETTRAELEKALASLQSQAEVVAAEGLVIDRTRTDRLLIDPAVEDIWEYEDAAWIIEEIPMRKSEAQALFPDFDFTGAVTYKAGGDNSPKVESRGLYSPAAAGEDDPVVVVCECWSRLDGTIYTLVDGCHKQFAVPPYQPKLVGERWWPYFILPFQAVDGEFTTQSLVDVLERLQEEHNETRDKFAEVRKKIRPHLIASGDVKDKDITIKMHPELGEIVMINTGGQPLRDFVQPGTTMTLDPMLYDTTPIRSDWEVVSGLQDAARSVVVTPKTATEAAISDQSLAARVSEFRDQIEDWLTEIAQYASEMLLLALEPAQVEQIMGKHQEPSEEEFAAAALAGQPPPEAIPTYVWPQDRRPETVFSLIQMRIRSGSTAAPNKLQMQENWAKAVPLIEKAIMAIRTIEAGGGDATAERELVKETVARFDESIDVERFLPPKPLLRPALPAAGAPGMPGGITPPGALAPEPVMEDAGMQVGGRPMQVPIQ